MAVYSIRTTRAQEVGLQFSYSTQADHTLYPTQGSWFQQQIDTLVSNPMAVAERNAQLVSFDQSFATVPETEQPAARAEIEASIQTHGGTIIPAGAPMQPPRAVTP